LLDHAQERIGALEHVLDCGCRVGVGRRGIVAAERVDLRTNDGLRVGKIVAGAGSSSKTDQKCDEQDEDAHGWTHR